MSFIKKLEEKDGLAKLERTERLGNWGSRRRYIAMES